MKKYLLSLLSAVFTVLIPSFADAQQQEQCATSLCNQLQESRNPALAEQRRNFYKAAEKIIQKGQYKSSRSVVTIPVVVHVIYRINNENIPDEQIQSQIDVLNEDYGRTNPDAALTPTVWSSLAADVGIQFCLASRKPNGDWTNGIERRQCVDTVWQSNNYMKLYSQGGLDAWDPTSYLNLWVCNLGYGVLGYSWNPIPLDTFFDGVVVRSRAFGRIDYVTPPYDKGRTATHEIGHWLGLYHPWGSGPNNFNCSGTDGIHDTPKQQNPTSGCPLFPRYDACSFSGCEATPDTANPCSDNGIMFMNYMDYTNDACMNMFTQEQSSIMNLYLDSFRTSMHTSLGCTAPISVNEINAERKIVVYPNPAHDIIRIRCNETSGEKISISLCDAAGKQIIVADNFIYSNSSSLDVSSLDAGVYFLKLTGKNFSSAARFVLMR